VASTGARTTGKVGQQPVKKATGKQIHPKCPKFPNSVWEKEAAPKAQGGPITVVRTSSTGQSKASKVKAKTQECVKD
jgi:hypothetical protein